MQRVNALFFEVTGLVHRRLAFWESASDCPVCVALWEYPVLMIFGGPVFMELMATPGRGQALYEELKARILDNTYPAGTALPSTRACAAERGLSRTTVTMVYEQLASEGYLHSRPGAASRVAGGLHKKPTSNASERPLTIKKAIEKLPALSAYGRNVASLPPQPVSPEASGLLDFSYGPLVSCPADT